ncbi:MAG TPA: hypothetical protein VKQ27_08765 [Acetobacteraceae bacterium]|nr:hypothetical protein [Acetobacteraceae bacterium]
MDNREAIARIIDRFSCTHWDAGAKYDLTAEILALLTHTEKTDEQEIARPRCGCPTETVRRVIQDHGTCGMGGCPYGGDI